MTSEITQLIPLYECDFKVSDRVRVIDTDCGFSPDDEVFVLGVEWRHQRDRRDFGWNITIASADDIAKGYGATDGWRPEELTPVPAALAARPAPEAEDMVERLRNRGGHVLLTGGYSDPPEPDMLLLKAADIIQSQAARIASLSTKVAEVERGRDREGLRAEEQWAGWVKADVAKRNAEARAERLDKALREIASRNKNRDQLQEMARAALQQEGESDE